MSSSDCLFKVTIRFPAGFAGRVELTGSTQDVRGVWDTSGGPWVIALPGAYYRVRPEAKAQPNPFAGGGLFAVDGEDLDVQL